MYYYHGHGVDGWKASDTAALWLRSVEIEWLSVGAFLLCSCRCWWLILCFGSESFHPRVKVVVVLYLSLLGVAPVSGSGIASLCVLVRLRAFSPKARAMSHPRRARLPTTSTRRNLWNRRISHFYWKNKKVLAPFLLIIIISMLSLLWCDVVAMGPMRS